MHINNIALLYNNVLHTDAFKSSLYIPYSRASLEIPKAVIPNSSRAFPVRTLVVSEGEM